MPPKLLACIRFLYKVVHKIGRLRKFNRSREIEVNFFTAWTIFMTLGTLVHHFHGYKMLPQIFNFCQGTYNSYGLSKSKKRGKIITKLSKTITKAMCFFFLCFSSPARVAFGWKPKKKKKKKLRITKSEPVDRRCHAHNMHLHVTVALADSIEWTSQFLHGHCEEEEEISPSP